MKRVVVGIIKKEDPVEYLLVATKKDHGEFTGFYSPPGGHVEKGETDIEALKREIYEELSMNVVGATKITETLADVPDQETIWYFCEVEDYGFTVDFDELRDAKFFTPEQMEALHIWPTTKKFFFDYIFNA